MSPNSDSHDSDQRSTVGGNLKIIDLEFETLRQFREVMAPRLAYEGFFVATNDPLPKGTPARFRFLLPDGFVLVEGTAVVAWARREAEEADDRPGMALLFNELEHQSREIVDELIDFHIATGGDPFEIGPLVSDPGDIGTDALSGDPREEREALPEPEPFPDSAGSEGKRSEGILPDWLSEVAQKHDVDLMGDSTVPNGGGRKEVAVPHDPEPEQQEFEISLMPEEDEMEPAPLFTDESGLPDVTVPPPEKRNAARGLRLKSLLAVGAVFVVAAVVVWWFGFRRVGGTPPEPVVVFEETTIPEAPIEVAERLAEAEADNPAETAEETPDEPAETPPEVTEPEPEPPRLEEVAGPATRVLLVAATRVGNGTVVTVRGNGKLSLQSVRVSLLKDPARVWIRIPGIETFYRPNDIEVGTPEVERVRVGHHPEETPQSLYVVCDLADAAAVVREHTVEGDTLRVVIGQP